MTTTFWGPNGEQVTVEQFLKNLFGYLYFDGGMLESYKQVSSKQESHIKVSNILVAVHRMVARSFWHALQTYGLLSNVCK